MGGGGVRGGRGGGGGCDHLYVDVMEFCRRSMSRSVSSLEQQRSLCWSGGRGQRSMEEVRGHVV